MPKICKNCKVALPEVEPPVPPKGASEAGMAPPEVEVPVPPKGGGAVKKTEVSERCPNCGKVGTLEDVPEVPTGEEEQE